jgi:hypothetical protein
MYPNSDKWNQNQHGIPWIKPGSSNNNYIGSGKDTIYTKLALMP